MPRQVLKNLIEEKKEKKIYNVLPKAQPWTTSIEEVIAEKRSQQITFLDESGLTIKKLDNSVGALNEESLTESSVAPR